MKNQNIQTWVDETDLLVDSKQLNQEGSEFNPVSVESILEDEKGNSLYNQTR